MCKCTRALNPILRYFSVTIVYTRVNSFLSGLSSSLTCADVHLCVFWALLSYRFYVAKYYRKLKIIVT